MSYHVLYIKLFIQSYTVYIYIYYIYIYILYHSENRKKNSRFLTSFSRISISPYHICPHDYSLWSQLPNHRDTAPPNHWPGEWWSHPASKVTSLPLEKADLSIYLYIYIYILCNYLFIIYISIYTYTYHYILKIKIKTRNIAGFHGLNITWWILHGLYMGYI